MKKKQRQHCWAYRCCPTCTVRRPASRVLLQLPSREAMRKESTTEGKVVEAGGKRRRGGGMERYHLEGTRDQYSLWRRCIRDGVLEQRGVNNERRRTGEGEPCLADAVFQLCQRTYNVVPSPDSSKAQLTLYLCISSHRLSDFPITSPKSPASITSASRLKETLMAALVRSTSKGVSPSIRVWRRRWRRRKGLRRR
jgi:hypothetical protein